MIILMCEDLPQGECPLMCDPCCGAGSAKHRRVRSTLRNRVKSPIPTPGFSSSVAGKPYVWHKIGFLTKESHPPAL